jgi:hypothetical protein
LLCEDHVNNLQVNEQKLFLIFGKSTCRANELISEIYL